MKHEAHDHNPMHQNHAGHGMGQGDMPDFHGMLLFGENNTFLSHLPMFNHPHHDFQVLMEVRLLDSGGEPSPDKMYKEDRQTSGARVYTLAPNENFVLSDLFSDENRQGRTSFPGAVWRGHFERSGRHLLVQEAQVNIDRIFHFRQFDSEEKPLDDLTYIIFGTDQERYLAHRITCAPDFDQVLKIEVIDTDLVHTHLNDGLSRVIVPSRPNTADTRLAAGEEIGATLNYLGHPHKIQLKVVEELYFEESELRERPDFGQSEAEQQAGF